MLLVGAATTLLFTAQATLGAGAATHRSSAVAKQQLISGPPVAAEERLSPAATDLLSRFDGSLPALRAAGNAALAAARNEATAADFLMLPRLTILEADIEQRGLSLTSADAARLAAAVAGLRYDSELIHNRLLTYGGARLILVNLQEQRLVAYDRGGTVVDTPVTTGRAALSTDIGLMHILGTDPPWTMKSPWPKGSPLWYPDTPFDSVAWFTSTGEGFHDAPWEPTSAFGAGSENGPYASHGCIHLPSAAQAKLFAWVTVGTPIVVIPGDGTPVGQQVSQQSVDQQGDPVGGLRGA